LLSFARSIVPFCLLLAAAACDRSPEPANERNAASGTSEAEALPEGRLDRSHAGQQAPEVPIEAPDGSEARLSDFEGKPLLVNFWATWCAPCVVEMPTLDALAARDGERLKVLTVSEDRDGREKVDAFFAKQKLRNLEAYLDPELELMAQVKGDTLPTTILSDSEGREVWRMVGMAEWTSEEAAKLLGEAS
jgi:thiol-disulfide isomerase/thioredoxin